MKKIVLFIDSLGAGGAQRQLVGLAIFLKEKGYNIEVVFQHGNLFYADELNDRNVPYVHLIKAERNFWLIPQYVKFIRRESPDIVIAYLPLPSICACIGKLFLKSSKLIVSERNTTQKTNMFEWLRFQLFRLADYVVPNSYSQEDYIKQNFTFLTKKVVTIPNFVDLQHFCPPFQRNRRDTPEIVIAASIWAPKNTLGFIDAVSLLKDKGFNYHVSWYGLIEGTNEYADLCLQKIKDTGVSDFITIKKKTHQISEIYRNADYFCLPSFFICSNKAIVSGQDNIMLFDFFSIVYFTFKHFFFLPSFYCCVCLPAGSFFPSRQAYCVLSYK